MILCELPRFIGVVKLRGAFPERIRTLAMPENDENQTPFVEQPPAGEAAPSAPAAQTPGDEFDPATWRVPLICKDCGKRFDVPFRHFKAGVVFHCASCRGSFVPNRTLHRMVQETFESFYGKRKREREAFEKRGDRSEEPEFIRKQESELKAFREKLDQMAREMKPAGKMVKRRGLASMFT
jgi:hypothetical protein